MNRDARRTAAILGTLIAFVAATSAVLRARAADEASAALFTQMAAVLQHPRCMNCHARGDAPHQGDDSHRHTMNVARGPDDTGSAGLHCGTCHQQNNYESSGVPGAEGWRQAPARMAWEGLSVGGLCRTIRDPKAGAMQPQQLVDHFHTSLVMWAWMPGSNARGDTRSTPPLSFDEFIALTRKWVASGAACPR